MKKFIVPGIVLAIGAAIAFFFFKVIAGAIGIISSFINAVITVVIVCATLLIVFWMFAYASKKK